MLRAITNRPVCAHSGNRWCAQPPRLAKAGNTLRPGRPVYFPAPPRGCHRCPASELRDMITPESGVGAPPKRSCEATFERRRRGGSETVALKVTVKEPPRRASRVSPPDSGGEFYAAPRVDYSFTRSSAGAYAANGQFLSLSALLCGSASTQTSCPLRETPSRGWRTPACNAFRRA